jgi:predicted metal-dependent hydrolase
VQLRLPLSGAIIGHNADVIFVRHRRARRYILRVLADGTLRVTLPRWGVKRDAQAFVEASHAWIDRQRRRRLCASPVDEPWRNGTTVMLDGCQATLRVEPRPDGVSLWCDQTLVTATLPTNANLKTLVTAWLRRRASRELPAMVQALAAEHEIAVPRVSVRDQRSRWGACSPSGTITLNWRLIQTPPFVREYVLLHELMHRRELNHSRRFWKLVAACCPRHVDARQWLRKEGKSLWSDRE